MKARFFLALWMGLGALAPALAARSPQEILQSMGVGTMEPAPAPDFTVYGLDGDTLSLADLRGKVVFLNFWATWCPPCRREMPSMEKLWKALSDLEGFTIVAVDVKESAQKVRRFAESQGYTFPIYLDPRGNAARSYRVRGIPTTFILNPQGQVIGGFVGGRVWDKPEVIEGFRALVKYYREEAASSGDGP